MNQNSNLIQEKKEDTKVPVNLAANSTEEGKGIYLAGDRNKNVTQKRKTRKVLGGMLENRLKSKRIKTW